MTQNSVNIEIQRACNDPAPEDDTLRYWAQHALGNAGEARGEITLRLVTEEEITALNSQYRQKPQPTNVLSFPLAFPESLHQADFLIPLGDIAICAAVVHREAHAQHKQTEAHWAHMVTHGILHLLGYDHIEDSDAEEMETLEVQILKQLGFDDPYQ